MKATTEQYNHIAAEMKRTLQAIPAKHLEDHMQLLRKDSRVKDANKRLRWDLFNASSVLTKYCCDTLYVTMDDTHIDTVLRKIQKEIGLFV